MSSISDEEERARAEAADWFARARGPNAGEVAAELAAWLAERPANEAAYTRLLRRWDQSAFLTNATIGRRRDLRRVSVWTRRPVTRRIAAAAAVVLVVGIAAIGGEALRFSRPAVPPIAYASADREVRAIILADGSRATLDAGSAIKVQYEKGHRLVRLTRGRVRFDVAPSPTAPFLVDAGGGSVVAKNGLFDISLDRGVVRVVSWRGALDVRGEAGASPAVIRMRRITAGQQLAFVPARDMPHATFADRGELGWARGMLSFDRARLADAVAAINRYTDTPIILDPPRIGALRVTGAFRASDAEGFARAAGVMFDLSLRRSPDGAIILTPGIKT